MSMKQLLLVLPFPFFSYQCTNVLSVYGVIYSRYSHSLFLSLPCWNPEPLLLEIKLRAMCMLGKHLQLSYSPVPDTSYEWNFTARDHLYLASFTQHTVLKVYLKYSLYQYVCHTYASPPFFSHAHVEAKGGHWLLWSCCSFIYPLWRNVCSNCWSFFFFFFSFFEMFVFIVDLFSIFSSQQAFML